MSDVKDYVEQPKHPENEKDTCIMILNARIKDLRKFEKYLEKIKVPFDKKRIAKKIGGLRKCIDYIKNH